MLCPNGYRRKESSNGGKKSDGDCSIGLRLWLDLRWEGVIHSVSELLHTKEQGLVNSKPQKMTIVALATASREGAISTVFGTAACT